MLSFIEHHRINFPSLLGEASGSAENTKMADAYERGTVLHIHDNTGAYKNPDPEYQAKITQMRAQHKKDLAALSSPARRRDIMNKSKASAEGYLDSLEQNHGVNRKDITHVFHTNKGIDNVIGRTVERKANPQDLMVKFSKQNGKKAKPGEDFHGSSLKATTGTASNTPVASFDRDSGIGTNLNKIWTKHLHNAGLNGKQISAAKNMRAERKRLQKLPKVEAAYRAGQAETAQHHADTFDRASLNKKKDHLRQVLKLNPDAAYDLTKGDGSSVPHDQLPHAAAINNAKSIRTEVRKNLVHFFDHNNNHIATVEHRAVKGPMSALQANAKLGSLKPMKGAKNG
jgi:hypothetical protein